MPPLPCHLLHHRPHCPHRPQAKLACVALRLPLLLLRLWPLSAAAGSAGLREGVLRALANYVAHCGPAKCSLTVR